MRNRPCFLCTLVFLAAAPSEAKADLRLSPSGTVNAVSDYRFRGISLSDEDPALQASLNLEEESGFYAGVWGSTLARTSLYGRLELDLYGGWRGAVANETILDLGLLYYLYPGGKNIAGKSDFAEPYASVTHDFGPLSGKVGAAYAWAQDATGGGDNLYLYSDWSGDLPGAPVTLRAHLGRSSGTLSPTGDYFDWAVGADFAVGPATIGISYVDTDLDPAENFDSGILVSLGVAF